MRRSKFFLCGLCVFALCFTFMSCEFEEPTKEGKIVLRNNSSYGVDNPMTARLTGAGGDIDRTNSINRGDRVTWNDLPAESYYTITVTDQNNRSTNHTYIYLGINDKKEFSYNGTSISIYSPSN